MNNVCRMKKRQKKLNKICSRAVLILSKLKIEDLTHEESYKKKLNACVGWMKKKIAKLKK